MKVLCIGDVVGTNGLEYLCSRLPALRRETDAQLVVVNAENCSSSGVGLGKAEAEQLLQYADVLTGGNHSLRRAKMQLYSENERILCPANLPYAEDEAGCCVVDTGRHGTIRVINLAGVAWMEPIDSPFKRADALLKKGNATYTVVDFHAESTAEKKALAFYLDGRVSAFFGTHTHVQTADEQILPGGTGYITDVGMTGPALSVIGVRPQDAIERQRMHVPVVFNVADGPCTINAVLFTLNAQNGLCSEVRRIIL